MLPGVLMVNADVKGVHPEAPCMWYQVLPSGTPDPLPSSVASVTPTVLLFQPAALGSGSRVALLVGGVRSSFTATVFGVSLLPAAS